MDKQDIQKQYHMVRDAKQVLDHMLGQAPDEIRQEFRDQYARDTGVRYAVNTGVPTSVRRKARKAEKKTRHASRGQYLAAVASIRTAMHRRGWSA